MNYKGHLLAFLVLSISLISSLFLIASLLSNFFLLLPIPILIFARPFLKKIFKGIIIKFFFLISKSHLVISLLLSNNFLDLIGS